MNEEGVFCTGCGGPHPHLPEYGGHWDTCPNRPQVRASEEDRAQAEAIIAERATRQAVKRSRPYIVRELAIPTPLGYDGEVSAYCASCGYEEDAGGLGPLTELVIEAARLSENHNATRHPRRYLRH